METRDNAGGDGSRFDDDEFAAEFAHDDAYDAHDAYGDDYELADLSELSEHDGSLADTELHHALRNIADQIPPMRDPLTGVLERASQLRRRRRTVRALGTVAALAIGAAVSPALFDRDISSAGPDIAVAAPPSTVAELPDTVSATSPAATSASAIAVMPDFTLSSVTPVTALGWPSRGVTAPAQVTAIAKAYLMTQASRSGMPGPITTEVHQLWAQQDEQSQAKTTWLFIGEGWTTGPRGLSQAYLVYVAWDGGKQPVTGASVAQAPNAFLHPTAAGSSDSTAVEHISELSFVLPSARLLVLGAPQVERILYSESGGKTFAEQKTVDGVALFPRTAKLTQGKYLDEVQVRNAGNVALTPPGGWPAGDYDFSSAAWFDMAMAAGTAPTTGAVTGPFPTSMVFPGQTTVAPPATAPSTVAPSTLAPPSTTTLRPQQS